MSWPSKLTSWQVAQHVRAQQRVCTTTIHDRTLSNATIRFEPKLPLALRGQQRQRGTGETNEHRPFGASTQPTTKAPVLGTRLQRPTVLDIQQSIATSKRKVRNGGKVLLPQVRRRVYQDDRTEWAPGARQMHQAATRLRRQRMMTTILLFLRQKPSDIHVSRHQTHCNLSILRRERRWLDIGGKGETFARRRRKIPTLICCGKGRYPMHSMHVAERAGAFCCAQGRSVIVRANEASEILRKRLTTANRALSRPGVCSIDSWHGRKVSRRR